MDGFDQAAVRGEDGRWLPGQSGNPAGKRPGTKNRATSLAETLEEGEAEAMARLVVEKALAGDGVAARFCLGRLFPKPRGRAIRLALPKGARPGDVVAAFNAVMAAMAAGEITPEEALIVTRVLDGRRRALEAFALEKKLTRYGERIAGDEVGVGVAEEESAHDATEEPPAALTPSNPLPFTGEGRVRAGAGVSDGAAVAPIPSPRPSPVNGRGSDGGESGRGSREDGESLGVSAAALLPPNLQSACNAAALAALERQQLRRMAMRMGLLPQAPAP